MFRYALTADAWLAPTAHRDAAQILAAIDRSREHLGRWLAWVDTTKNVKDVEGFLERRLSAQVKGEALVCCIRTAEGVVGVIEAFHINSRFRSAEIGYWLAADSTRQGLMTAATQALVSHLLGDFGLNRIDLFAATGNAASRAIAERLGFQLEGINREALWLKDVPYDLAHYAMLKMDWRARLDKPC